MFVRVKASVRIDNTGNTVEVPALLTPTGLLEPLLDYLVESAFSRSPSWMNKVLRSVRLLCYYMQANPNEGGSRNLLKGFALALEQGTFDKKTGSDESGLNWSPRSAADRQGVITDLNLFFDWLGERNATVAAVNPAVNSNAYEQRWNAAARTHKRDSALLGHLWSAKNSDIKARRVSFRRAPVAKPGEPPAFPEDRFADLITDGFRVGQRVDHRGICITLLMNGAGFRVSEPFHMFVQDAGPDPTQPNTSLVAIHHPSAGFAPESWCDPATGRRGTREAYLATKYGLKPRHLTMGSNHSGWKGGLYDRDNYKLAHWFLPWYGEVFLHHWERYLEQLIRVKRDHHPYLWVNLLRGEAGSPYKLGAFLDAHADACRRIGLSISKQDGTTDHGHRHAYGQRARRAGLDTKTIQMMLHHASEKSQDVYTSPGNAEIKRTLSLAHVRLGEALPVRLTNLINRLT